MRLPVEDTRMALHRYLAKLVSISAATPLGIGVLLIKWTEIIGT
jgi:hypothetical protein